MEILIYIVFPDVNFIIFKAGLAVKIDEILEEIGHQYVLIHEGTELLPNLTVGFYNLKYGARIWAVPKNNPFAINRFKYQNCTFDYLVKLFRSLKKFEDTKRSDLIASKGDAEPKWHRRVLKMYADYEDKTDDKPLEITETIYVKPDKPCSDPIPPFLLFCGVRF